MPAVPAIIGAGGAIGSALIGRKGGGATPGKVSGQLAGVAGQAGQAYGGTQGPSALESEMAPISQDFYNRYSQAAGQQMQDYGDIMGGYRGFMEGLGGPTKFGFRKVSAERPAELGESYGYLREAVPGYREFATTGGYSPTDIQELRARGVSPIRSAYGSAMMELNRARALGGAGGAPNYIAALSRAQRELPGQMADAMTGVNAQLAQDIRSGRLSGLAGLTGIGGTMGGLSSAEASRMLQAALANQAADLQAQGMGEQSLQNLRQMQLAALGGQAGLYGTTPGMAATFGNQALSAYQLRQAMESSRNQFGLGLLDAQIRGYGGQPMGPSWGQTIMSGIGSAIPYMSRIGQGGGYQLPNPSQGWWTQPPS